MVISLRNVNNAKLLASYVIDKIADQTHKKSIPVTVSAGICGGTYNEDGRRIVAGQIHQLTALQ